jgi:site-specific DNA-methyltransferase (adenine-specific)
MNAPYYQDELVTLYHGDCRDILPALGQTFDLIVTDPPYGETSLDWDRWLNGWPGFMSQYARSMWCFGTLRMYLDHAPEFSDWKLSQDVIWEKHNGSGFHADRFRRVHEQPTHWYRGDWASIHHEAQTTATASAKRVHRKQRPAHTGQINSGHYASVEGGPLLMTSVIFAKSMHGRAIHPTQKPVAILEPLISYACPPGGIIVDPFGGSCSTAVAARNLGRRCIVIEKLEAQCERSAKWLSHEVLDLGEPA